MDFYSLVKSKVATITEENIRKGAEAVARHSKAIRRGINYHTTEAAERRRVQRAEYNSRPDVRERARMREQSPERKAQHEAWRKSPAGIESGRRRCARYNDTHPENKRKNSRNYYNRHKDEPEFKAYRKLQEQKFRYCRKAKAEGTYTMKEIKSEKSETLYIIDGAKDRAFLRVTGQQAMNPKVKAAVDRIRRSGATWDEAVWIAKMLASTY